MIPLNRPACPDPKKLETDYAYKVNKEALASACNYKCMYCESKIGHSSYAQIEHIKPKSKYKHLTFVWENLGYCCQVCNTTKLDHYNEKEPILNPYDEDPSEHLMIIGVAVREKNNSIRGKHTINEEFGVDLNRPALLEKRREAILDVERLAKECLKLNEKDRKPFIQILIDKSKEDQEYSLTIKSLLEAKGLL